MNDRIIAQDAYIEWDDYHAEYTVEFWAVCKVEPFGEWHTVIPKTTLTVKDLQAAAQLLYRGYDE